MAECHAALIGAAAGAVGPMISSSLGIACGMSPDFTGSQVLPRQPVGVVALFGALASASAGAFAAMAAQSAVLGAAAGVVAAGFVTVVSTVDMLKRRNLLVAETQQSAKAAK
ncbi:unnamed protein product [Effrenium voratum]|nr:unnamed protein product [Effrenium voratum]